MDGIGKQTWPDGRSYDGNWIKSKRNGHGAYIAADG